MSFTRTQLIANVREMMDATGSARWSDAYIATALGVVGVEEWQRILGANPFYKFAQVSVTANSLGQFTFASLTTGSADAVKNWYRILAITDGNSIVYAPTTFTNRPLATVGSSLNPSAYEWYEAGDSVQILPVAATALTVTVNWTPTAIDLLSAGSVTVDFPAGHESILWLAAAAFLLDKGGAEPEAAAVLLASAERRRQALYDQIGRRNAAPLSMAFPDSSAEWGA